MEAPPPEPDDKRVVLWAAGFIAGAVVLWGLSMFVLRLNLEGMLTMLMQDRERQKSLQSWVKRANELDIDYKEALFDPEGARNKPVVWDVKIPQGDQPAFCDEDLDKPVRWTNPGALRLPDAGGKGKDHRTFRVVAVIRQVDPPESVRQALGKKYPGPPGHRVYLEYLGYE